MVKFRLSDLCKSRSSKSSISTLFEIREVAT